MRFVHANVWYRDWTPVEWKNVSSLAYSHREKTTKVFFIARVLWILLCRIVFRFSRNVFVTDENSTSSSRGSCAAAADETEEKKALLKKLSNLLHCTYTISEVELLHNDYTRQLYATKKHDGFYCRA